jgi:hypothetical protein
VGILQTLGEYKTEIEALVVALERAPKKVPKEVRT